MQSVIVPPASIATMKAPPLWLPLEASSDIRGFLQPLSGQLIGTIAEPVGTFILERLTEILAVKGVEIGKHVEERRVARRHDFDRQLSHAAGAKVLADRHPLRLGDSIWRAEDLLELLPRAAYADPAANLPIDPVVTELVSAVAFDESTGCVFATDDVEVVG